MKVNYLDLFQPVVVTIILVHSQNSSVWYLKKKKRIAAVYVFLSRLVSNVE